MILPSKRICTWKPAGKHYIIDWQLFYPTWDGDVKGGEIHTIILFYLSSMEIKSFALQFGIYALYTERNFTWTQNIPALCNMWMCQRHYARRSTALPVAMCPAPPHSPAVSRFLTWSKYIFFTPFRLLKPFFLQHRLKLFNKYATNILTKVWAESWYF